MNFTQCPAFQVAMNDYLQNYLIDKSIYYFIRKFIIIDTIITFKDSVKFLLIFNFLCPFTVKNYTTSVHSLKIRANRSF